MFIHKKLLCGSLQKMGVFALFAAVLLANFNVKSAFAENDPLCKYKITGTTALSNPNAGTTYFDEENAVGLGILGLGSGFAPQTIYAACASDQEDNLILGVDEYVVRGYAWNDNLGFISFYCGDGFGGVKRNEGLLCGAQDYAVVISAADVNGERVLGGYAWNSAFGYISMQGNGVDSYERTARYAQAFDLWKRSYSFGGENYDVELVPNTLGSGGYDVIVNGVTRNVLVAGSRVEFDSGVFVSILAENPAPGGLGQVWTDMRLEVEKPFTYGVKMDVDGNLTGYGYSQSDVYVNFTGAKINLVPEVIGNRWCDGKPYLCVEVGIEGTDGRLDDPATLRFVENADLDAGGIKVADGKDAYYVDVFLREADGVTPMNFANYDMPHLFNSLRFVWEDKVKINQLAGNVADADLSNLRNPWQIGKGAVVYKPIGLFSTTGVNLPSELKLIDAAKGQYRFESGITSFAPTTRGNLSFTTSLNPPVLFSNELFLFDYFKGAKVEANNLKLKHVEYSLRTSGGVPVVAAESPVFPNGKNGLALEFRAPVAVELFVGDREDNIVASRNIPLNFNVGVKTWKNILSKISNDDLAFKLAYSAEETLNSDACQGATDVNFDFHFVTDFSGGEIVYEDGQETLKALSTPLANISGGVNLMAMATLPQTDALEPEEQQSARPCSVAQGPGLYTEVKYQIDGKMVSYYLNKLPRLAGNLISNPAAVIQGVVSSQTNAFIPNEQVEISQGGTGMNQTAIRSVVNQNIAKFLVDLKPSTTTNLCKLQVLDGATKPADCSEGYKWLVVGEEKVLYLKNNDLVIDLASGGSFTGKYVVVVEDGNVFLDGDVYNAVAGENYLSLVVIRNFDKKYAQAGNVYLHPEVKNLQVNFALDGTLFSYNGDRAAGIDSDSGEPVWSSDTERLNVLGRQLRIEGSILSKNTIGGADLDTATAANNQPKKYLLLGTGEVLGVDRDGNQIAITIEDRRRAQYSDLNYLRLFRLKMQFTAEGLPVDLQCNKGLNNEDIMKISLGETVVNEVSGEVCNGINPLLSFADGGDLMPPNLSEEILAEGLDADKDFSPVYIQYRKPYEKSFIFNAGGALKIN